MRQAQGGPLAAATMKRYKQASSSLQKTYNQCHLTISYAAYNEQKGNEKMALQYWTEALEAIYYHNAYQVPSGWVPSTETDTSYATSLRSMELQCKERIDILKALEESRKETAAAVTGDLSTGGKISKAISKTPQLNIDGETASVGGGTVPAVKYNDIPSVPKPPRSAPPPLPQRPAFLQKNSSERAVVGSRSFSIQQTPRPSSSRMAVPTLLDTQASGALAPPAKKSSRSPSPGGRTMRTTLRTGKDKKKEKVRQSSPKKESSAVMSKAASLAWQSAGVRRDSSDLDAENGSRSMVGGNRAHNGNVLTLNKTTFPGHAHYDSRTRTLVYDDQFHPPAPTPPSAINFQPGEPTGRPRAASQDSLSEEDLAYFTRKVNEEIPDERRRRPKQDHSPPEPPKKFEPVSYPSYPQEYPETTAKAAAAAKFREAGMTVRGDNFMPSPSKWAPRKPMPESQPMYHTGDRDGPMSWIKRKSDEMIRADKKSSRHKWASSSSEEQKQHRSQGMHFSHSREQSTDSQGSNGSGRIPGKVSLLKRGKSNSSQEADDHKKAPPMQRDNSTSSLDSNSSGLAAARLVFTRGAQSNDKVTTKVSEHGASAQATNNGAKVAPRVPPKRRDHGGSNEGPKPASRKREQDGSTQQTGNGNVIKRKNVASSRNTHGKESRESDAKEEGVVLSLEPNSSGPPMHAKHRKSKQKQKEKAILADDTTPTTEDENEDAETAVKSAWEIRKEALMKNLPAGVDEGAAKQIFNEIVVQGDEVHWEDVAGLHVAKKALKEAVVYPFLRPDLFMGLREPARGMLLFGPPGTGKTMLARAVATESKSTFFSISASSLTSKYLGESEKLVRALFMLAKALAPSIIFVDEIDSLLSSRSGSGEHEATRRIKTEFLIQWSDLQRAAAGREQSAKEKERGDASRVLVLAATNLPWAIDEAARRRFVRRQYIPLPEGETRETQLRTLLGHQNHGMTEEDIQRLVELTDGFSGSDITALAKDAAMGPLRALGEALLSMRMDEIRPIQFEDFEASLTNIRPSVSKEGLKEFEDWAIQFGERGG